MYLRFTGAKINVMVVFGSALLCLVLALLALGLDKVYFYLPAKELKYRADKGDVVSRQLFRGAGCGRELRLLLSLEAVVLLAASFVLIGRTVPPVVSAIVFVLVLLVSFVWLPRSRVSRPAVQLAVWCTPLVARKLGVLHPVLQVLTSRTRRRPAVNFTGLYERADFIQLLDRQAVQRVNPIADQELDLMRHALQFYDFKVRDAMVPREQVKAVNADEAVGPIFLAD